MAFQADSTIPLWVSAHAALRQGVGLGIIGVVCFTAQLVVQFEELVAQAEALVASEDS
jgi:hypothetical protein